ncbi:F-box only 16 isoform X1 [Pelobates cultripes]|uniref:F-box only 16 isoform X1 n=1 Tax=Pelobates cultripes TaxID=61616 RepID=A0AAD1RA23_PELCU|nr:F-box only 16 isoform X1 [Pelobates cultripes]
MWVESSTGIELLYGVLKTYDGFFIHHRHSYRSREFDKWSDAQRRRILCDFFERCTISQLRFCNNHLQGKVPKESVDFTTFLPRVLSLYIFSFLDPRSLCRCAQVSWHWKSLTELDQLWMPKCLRFGWYINFTPTPFEQCIWKRQYIEMVKDLNVTRPRTPPRDDFVVTDVQPIAKEALDMKLSSAFNHRSLSIKQQSKGLKDLPPWRSSDKHPTDTVRFNYLDNYDPMEQARQARKYGFGTSNRNHQDSEKRTKSSPTSYKLRKAKSLCCRPPYVFPVTVLPCTLRVSCHSAAVPPTCSLSQFCRPPYVFPVTVLPSTLRVPCHGAAVPPTCSLSQCCRPPYVFPVTVLPSPLRVPCHSAAVPPTCSLSQCCRPPYVFPVTVLPCTLRVPCHSAAVPVFPVTVRPCDVPVTVLPSPTCSCHECCRPPVFPVRSGARPCRCFLSRCPSLRCSPCHSAAVPPTCSLSQCCRPPYVFPVTVLTSTLRVPCHSADVPPTCSLSQCCRPPYVFPVTVLPSPLRVPCHSAAVPPTCSLSQCCRPPYVFPVTVLPSPLRVPSHTAAVPPTCSLSQCCRPPYVFPVTVLPSTLRVSTVSPRGPLFALYNPALWYLEI